MIEVELKLRDKGNMSESFVKKVLKVDEMSGWVSKMRDEFFIDIVSLSRDKKK